MDQSGYVLFDPRRGRGGPTPLLPRPLPRLERSLHALGLPKPAQNLVALVTPFSATGDAVLRLEVRDGRASVTVRATPPLEAPAVIAAAEPHRPYPHKTTERDCFVVAAAEAERAEVDDALLLTHDGFVAEGTVWSVFWWDGDVLRTPTLDLGILPGVGRARVLELATRIEQGRYPKRQVAGESLFLANAVRGVVPITALDGLPASPDPRTAERATRCWPPR